MNWCVLTVLAGRFKNIKTSFLIPTSLTPSPDAPSSPTVLVAPSAGQEEGSSLTLTCHTDANPQANYTWYTEEGVGGRDLLT